MKNTCIVFLATSVVFLLSSCEKKTDTSDFDEKAKVNDTLVETAFQKILYLLSTAT